jgi:3-oxoacyl-[acyl-carrier protein] reductase
MQGEAQDRVALITGAGSETGIGFASARVLAREGASVAITSTTDRIHERAAALHGTGADAAGFVADLTDRDQARRMVAQVQQLFGRIDIVVNNAGMVNVGMDGENFLDFIDMNDADWDQDIAMNLHTAYNVTKAVVPGMVERGWGRIVMVSSVTGPLVTNPGSTGYGAAKGGMDGLMRGLAVELGAHGITANSVAPGWIATGSQSPEESDAGRHTPIGRSGTADEIGEVVGFLASNRASYITGQSIVVDGGNTIQEEKGA